MQTPKFTAAKTRAAHGSVTNKQVERKNYAIILLITKLTDWKSPCFSWGRKIRPLGKNQSILFLLDVWSEIVV